MVNAYVLICCDLASSEKVVEELEKIDGVRSQQINTYALTMAIL